MAPPGTIIGQIQPTPATTTLQTVQASPTQLPQPQSTLTTQAVTMPPQQQVAPTMIPPMPVKEEQPKIEVSQPQPPPQPQPQPPVIATHAVAPMEVQENGVTEGT